MKITIIGAGKLGVMLAKTLTAENHDITIIDINEDRVKTRRNVPATFRV